MHLRQFLQVLVSKLTVLWFKSYLTGLTQLVSYTGPTSSVGTITEGVPQGFVLGPLRLVMFINVHQ